MLERIPYRSDHLSFERENYFIQRQVLEQQGITAGAHFWFPREELNLQNDPLTVYGNGWQIPGYLAKCNSYSSLSKSQVVSRYTRMRSASIDGSSAVASVNTNFMHSVHQPIWRQGCAVKQNTFAYGPLHVEHSRKFNWSNESKSTFVHNSQLLLPWQQDVQFARQKPLSYQTYNPIYNERGRHLTERKYCKQNPQNGEQEHVKSRSRTPIIKMA